MTTTTQELIERLEKLIVDEVLDGDMRRTVRAAASRLSELQDEVVRLREALQYVDVLQDRAALDQQGERG